jgi:hypothetical protein
VKCELSSLTILLVQLSRDIERMSAERLLGDVEVPDSPADLVDG